MKSVVYSQRYLPHELSPVTMPSVSTGNTVMSASSAAAIRSQNPHSCAGTRPLTEQELKWISDYHRRNPNISVCGLYGKLRAEKGYSRHPGSLCRFFIRRGYRKKAESTKKASCHPKPYDTPAKLGIKWQMDVNYVPTACCSGSVPGRFCQCTVVEETSRERFIYPYDEQSSYSTVAFLKRVIEYFRYNPLILPTDNGAEFAHLTRTGRPHPLDLLCRDLGIEHKRIRSRTPRHNGESGKEPPQ